MELQESIAALTKGFSEFRESHAAAVKAATEKAENTSQRLDEIERRMGRAELDRKADPEPGRPVLEYRDSKGNRYKALGREHDLRKHVEGFDRDLGPHQLGHTIIGLATGRWSDPALQAKAQSTVSNVAGGYLTPDALSTSVIQESLNQSVMARAGARMIDVPANSLTIARVNSTPSFQVKAENDSFSEEDVSFDAIRLDPYTIGTLVHMSLELAQDSPNAASVIESALAQALAVKLDQLALRGTGSQEPLGVYNLDGVATTGSVGGIDFDALLDAHEDCLDANGMTSAFIMPNDLAVALAKLKSGDGSTSAALYLEPPAMIAGIPIIPSNQASSGTVYTGQIADNVLFGVRLSPTIQISTEAGEAFMRCQIAVRVLWRGDFAAERATRLVKLTGVTTS